MRAARAAAHGFGEVLITVGLALLLFVAWQLWWTDIAAGKSSNRSVASLQHQWAEPQAPKSGDAKQPVQLKHIPLGDAFALVRIPRFGHDYVRPIIQGVGLDVLDRGVGHYPDSADPGDVGNFAVAGHRVTYAKPFNQIAELRDGDAVVVETRSTWYVYRVVGHRIVTPDHVEVVAPVPDHPGRKPTQRMMTMTACHPKFSARQRYVVFSKLEQTIDKSTGGVPDALR